MLLRTLCTTVLSLASAGMLHPEDPALPPGEVAGGLVEDNGSALLLLRRSRSVDDGSFFVRLRGDKVTKIELPGIMAKRLTPLAGGRMLLYSHKGPLRDGDWALAYEILKLKRNDRVRHVWEWNSRDFPLGAAEFPVVVSRDGRAWGTARAAAFAFGGTRSNRAKATHLDRVHLDEHGPRTDQWKWMSDTPRFVFLDSEGPVIVTPWNNGAFVVHFTASGSSYSVPVLQDAEDEFGFRWQWSDRVLWALTERDWKAYHFWNLGVSPTSDEPFWRVAGAVEPHPERGIVRFSTRDDKSHRIEHVWREPWSLIEERHASEWYQGPQPVRLVGGGKGIFVSPNGQRAVVVEDRAVDGVRGVFARRLNLRSIVHSTPEEERSSEPPVRGLPVPPSRTEGDERWSALSATTASAGRPPAKNDPP